MPYDEKDEMEEQIRSARIEDNIGEEGDELPRLRMGRRSGRPPTDRLASTVMARAQGKEGAKGSLERNFNRLERSITALDQATAELIDRIGMILGPEMDDETNTLDGQMARLPQSRIGDLIDESADRISVIRARVDAVIERVEL